MKKSGTLPTISKEILKLLHNSKTGLTATNISKRLNLARRSTFRHLKNLTEKGIIIKKDQVYESAKSLGGFEKVAHLLNSDDVNLHNFSLVLSLIRKPIWWERRRNRLRRIGFKDQERLKNNPYEQLKNEHIIIQTFKNSIVIINRKKYLGKSAYDCFIQSIEDSLNHFKIFEDEIKFKFFSDNVPQMRVRSQHYVLLKRDIAKYCTKNGNLFEIYVNNELRGYIDFSEPFGFEFGNTDYAPEDNERFKHQVKDILINNPRAMSVIDKECSDTSDMLNRLTGIVYDVAQQTGLNAKNQQVYQENLKLHYSVLEKQEEAMRALTQEINKLDLKRASRVEPAYKKNRMKRIKEAYKKAFGHDYW